MRFVLVLFLSKLRIMKETIKKSAFLPIISAVLITLFLFFIDEGYYSFKWMSDLGNWMIFFIYIAFILLGQFLMGWVFYMMKESFKKNLIISLTGIIVGLTAVINILS